MKKLVTEIKTVSTLYVYSKPFQGYVNFELALDSDGVLWRVDFNTPPATVTDTKAHSKKVYYSRPFNNDMLKEGETIASSEVMDTLFKQHAKSKAKPPVEIDAATFDHMFGCMPPANWRMRAHYDVFMMCEDYDFDLNHWYARDTSTGKFYEFLDSPKISDSKIIKLLNAA